MGAEEKKQDPMGEFIKQLFSSSAKAFDVFNVGRLFFYTIAGGLALYPLLMILRLITLDLSELGSNGKTNTFFQILNKAGDLDIFIGGLGSKGNANLVAFIVCSVVVGFLVANLGYIDFY